MVCPLMILTLQTSEFSTPPCKQYTFQFSIIYLKESIFRSFSFTLESRLSHSSPRFLDISKGRPVISWKSYGIVNSSTSAQLPRSFAIAFSTKKCHLLAWVKYLRWEVGMRSSTTTSSRFPLMQRQQTASPTLLTQMGLIIYRQPAKLSSITCKISMHLVLPAWPIPLQILAISSLISDNLAQSLSFWPAPQMMELALAGKILSQNFFFSTKRWLAYSIYCEGTVLSSIKNSLFLRREALDFMRSWGSE